MSPCSFDHVIILIRYASLASWQSWHVSDAVACLPYWMSLETGNFRQSKSSRLVNLYIGNKRKEWEKRATFPTPIRPRGLQKSVFQYGLTLHACSEALGLSLTFEWRQDSEDWNYCWQVRWACSALFFFWLSSCSRVLKYSSVPHSFFRSWVSLIPLKIPCWCSGNEIWFFNFTRDKDPWRKNPNDFLEMSEFLWLCN